MARAPGGLPSRGLPSRGHRSRRSADGRREAFGCAVGEFETQDFWAQLPRGLHDLGLGGTQLVISDHHRDLAKATEAIRSRRSR